MPQDPPTSIADFADTTESIDLQAHIQSTLTEYPTAPLAAILEEIDHYQRNKKRAKGPRLPVFSRTNIYK